MATRLRLINEFAIETESAVTRRLRTRATELLFAYLALAAPRKVSRSEAISEIWGLEDGPSGRQKLRLALHSIRSAVGESLCAEDESLWLDSVSLDIHDPKILLAGENWRLMPGHEAEFLLAATREWQLEQELRPVWGGMPTEEPAEILQNLKSLLRLEPNNPDLYSQLHKTLRQMGHDLAARFVSSFARHQLGSRCPSELSAESSLSVRPDFTGRFIELTSLASLLLSQDEPAFVQVVGLGGIGKTRLAREIYTIAPSNQLPVCWIDCKEVRSPAELETEIAGRLAALHEFSSEEAKVPGNIPSTLMVLDNTDHLRFSDISFLEKFDVSECGLRVLVTCQSAHQMPGSRLLLAPLAVSVSNSGSELNLSESAELLVRLSGAEVSRESVESLHRLAQLSGGIPLAIRIISNSLRSFPIATVIDQLADRVYVGKFQSRLQVDEARHLSLQDCFTWSFGLLSLDCQAALIKISSLTGDFDELIRAALDIDTGVWSECLDTPWVQTERPRVYYLLPPIKQFLRAQTTGDPTVERRSAMGHLLRLIDTNYPSDYLLPSRIGEIYQADLHELVLHPTGLSLDEEAAALVGLQVTAQRFGRLELIIEKLGALIARHPSPRAEWRNLIGACEHLRGDYLAALGHYSVGVESGNFEAADVARANLGSIYLLLNQPDLALPYLEASVETTSHPRRKATRMLNLGKGLILVKRYREAIDRLNTALDMFVEIDNLISYEALCLQSRAEAELLNEEVLTADRSLSLAELRYSSTSQGQHRAEFFGLKAFVMAELGRNREAREALLELARQSNNVPVNLSYLIVVALKLGRSELVQSLYDGVDVKSLPQFCRCIALKLEIEWRTETESRYSSKDWLALARRAIHQL